MPDIGDFIRRSRRLAKIAIAAPGTPGDFRRSAYKIAKCVAGLTHNGTVARRYVLHFFFFFFFFALSIFCVSVDVMSYRRSTDISNGRKTILRDMDRSLLSLDIHTFCYHLAVFLPLLLIATRQ